MPSTAPLLLKRHRNLRIQRNPYNHLEIDYILSALAFTNGHTTWAQVQSLAHPHLVALWLDSDEVSAERIRMLTASLADPSITKHHAAIRWATNIHVGMRPDNIMLHNRLAERDPVGYTSDVLSQRSLNVNIDLFYPGGQFPFMAVGAGGGASGAFGQRSP